MRRHRAQRDRLRARRRVQRRRLRRHAVRPGGHAPLSAQPDLPGAAAQVQDRAVAAAATTARRARSTTWRFWRAFDNSERGFEIRVGGGLSTSPEDAHPLESFVPADRLLPVLEAVVRVFDRTGNRQNKSRARLKYVIRKIGMDGFRKEYEAELAKIDADGRGRIAIDVSNEVRPDAVLRLRAPVRQTAAEDGFERVLRDQLHQAAAVGLLRGASRGSSAATSPSAQLRGAARLARQFSDGTVRLSNEQNLVFRFVPEASLTALHAELVALGLGRAGARTIHDVTSCPGADTCNLAVTRSRELTTAVEDALAAATGAAAEAVQGGRVARHQDLGLPELVRAASRGRARLPRHHAPRGRAGGAGVSAAPRRRHRARGRDLRPADRQAAGAARARRGAAPARALSARSAARARRRWPTSVASSRRWSSARWPISPSSTRRRRSPKTGSTTATSSRSRSRSARASAPSEFSIDPQACRLEYWLRANRGGGMSPESLLAEKLAAYRSAFDDACRGLFRAARASRSSTSTMMTTATPSSGPQARRPPSRRFRTRVRNFERRFETCWRLRDAASRRRALHRRGLRARVQRQAGAGRAHRSRPSSWSPTSTRWDPAHVDELEALLARPVAPLLAKLSGRRSRRCARAPHSMRGRCSSAAHSQQVAGLLRAHVPGRLRRAQGGARSARSCSRASTGPAMSAMARRAGDAPRLDVRLRRARRRAAARHARRGSRSLALLALAAAGGWLLLRRTSEHCAAETLPLRGTISSAHAHARRRWPSHRRASPSSSSPRWRSRRSARVAAAACRDRARCASCTSGRLSARLSTSWLGARAASRLRLARAAPPHRRRATRQAGRGAWPRRWAR